MQSPIILFQRISQHIDPFTALKPSLFKLVNNILIGMENKKIMALAVMDLSAAFDTVPHDGLLEVLNCKFRIERTALQWIENYLRPRFFKVCINKEIFRDRRAEM